MKKILFINPHFPLFSTPTCGGANRSQMFLKALAHVGHVDVVSFWDNEESDLPNCKVIHSGCPEIGPTDSFGRVEKFIRLLAPWNANNIFPLNRSMECFCDEWIEKGDYDYIAVRYLFTAAEYGLLKYADRLIVDVDDKPRQSLLYDAHRANRVKEKIYKYLASWSAAIMSKIVLGKVNRSYYSNPIQAPSKCSVFLHNVTMNANPCSMITDTSPHNILIVGYMTRWANIIGTRHFLKEIYPLIKAAIPDVTLHVVGKYANDDFRKEVERYDGVSALGFVEDLDEEYTKCRVVAIPIYHGSGTSVRVMEAMWKLRPIVSTPMGVRGIGLKANEDYLVGRTDREFANQIILLLNDISLANNVANSAFAKAGKYYSQEEFIKIIVQSLR